jgi:hypothetical protein
MNNKRKRKKKRTNSKKCWKRCRENGPLYTFWQVRNKRVTIVEFRNSGWTIIEGITI